jgi:hypothetical protein
MPDRRFKLTRTTYPLTGICDACQKTFLSRTEDAAQAEKELRTSFHEHACETRDHEQNSAIDDAP